MNVEFDVNATTIRPAVAADGPGIVSVILTTWPEENYDGPGLTTRIARLLAAPERETLVAESNGTILGFADAFLTERAAGIRRWELDLLAVLPAYRGQGVARRLVTSLTESGLSMNVAGARALVRHRNRSAERCFYACGYRASSTQCFLYLSTDGRALTRYQFPAARLIPVSTFLYEGYWLEGDVAIREKRSGDSQNVVGSLVGAVIPIERRDQARALQRIGFEYAGCYLWWIYNY